LPGYRTNVRLPAAMRSSQRLPAPCGNPVPRPRLIESVLGPCDLRRHKSFLPCEPEPARRDRVLDHAVSADQLRRVLRGHVRQSPREVLPPEPGHRRLHHPRQRMCPRLRQPHSLLPVQPVLRHLYQRRSDGLDEQRMHIRSSEHAVYRGRLDCWDVRWRYEQDVRGL
jgi:hypothetical protein